MDSSLQIEIDGQFITGRIDGIGSFSVTTSVDDEDRAVKATYSNELTFYDDGYAIIKAALIDDVNGFAEQLPVRIFDEVCGKVVYEGVIKGDSIDWCEPECSVRANLIQDDPIASCIQNKLIYDDTYGFLNKNQFVLRYCIVHRPLFLQMVVNRLMAFAKISLYLLILIVGFLTFTVNLLIWAVCGIRRLFNRNIDCSQFSPGNYIDRLGNILTEIESFLDPCNNFHPSAFVRDYIQNVCKVCGISGFDSSILNNTSSPYYNTILFAAQVEKGRPAMSTNYTLIRDNLPVETLTTLMRDYLKPLFNADFRIINNRLIFERKDYFYTNNQIWINTQDIQSDGRLIDDQICFSWLDKKRYSYADLSYAEDPQEYLGNEARGRWDDIVEWNPPAQPPGQVYSSAQKGAYELKLACSPARFVKDGISEGLDSALVFNPDEKILCLAQQTAMNYKFLIADTSNNKGRIKTDYDDNFTGPGLIEAPSERYNYPFWFKEGYRNNLYSLFHYIENPRLPGNTRWGFNFKFEFTCAELDSFNFDKNISLVKNGSVVTGQIKEVSFDYINRIATVKGEI